jgi:hypothetical protein
MVLTGELMLMEHGFCIDIDTVMLNSYSVPIKIYLLIDSYLTFFCCA